MKVSKSRRHVTGYSEEARREALSLLAEGVARREVAKKIGCSQGSLDNWRKAASRQENPPVAPEILTSLRSSRNEIFSLAIVNGEFEVRFFGKRVRLD